MLVGDKYHLTYCTNIHPGQDWKTTFESLKTHLPGIRNKVAPGIPFGLGLRLSNRASEELAQDHHLPEFKSWLQDQHTYIFTMNGFPYGNFHGEAVKDKVYLPDWTSEDRVGYSCRLFEQLAYLIPEGLEGGISTSPLSYKRWYIKNTEKEKTKWIAVENLVRMAIFLRELEETTGSYLHIDLEPEPDCFLENTTDVVSFYKDYLLTGGSEMLSEHLSVSKERAEEILLKYICVCYDICHFSLAYEDPDFTFAQWNSLGIRTGKIQISAALKILAIEKMDLLWKDLSRFNEPTYLHQVTRKINNEVVTYPDLPSLLEQKPEFDELRAHFHVPIFLDSFGSLHSTQDHILKVFTYLQEHDVSNHLEIETYTWDVLPENLKTGLTSSIVREFEWVLENMRP